MISSSKALFVIIGFCLYFAVDCNCPKNGSVINYVTPPPFTCTDLLGTAPSPGSVTWGDNTTSVITSKLEYTLVAGQFLGSESGNVTAGRFINANVTILYTYADVSLGCLNNNGIANLTGIVSLKIAKGLGSFSCAGTSTLSSNPPITNTPQTVTIRRDVNYTNCIPVLIDC